jgi:GSH-dependent disulfide-bond oxidoreductase
LADKGAQLLPTEAANRYKTIQWLRFEIGGVASMFGQVGFFKQNRRQGLRR